MKVAGVSIPGPARIAAEALTVIAGALLAAWVIGKVPGVRDWIAAQWDKPKGCDCGKH